MADVLRPTPCRTILDHTDDGRPIPCTGRLHWTPTRAWNYGQYDHCGRTGAYRPGLDTPPPEHRPPGHNPPHPAAGPDRDPEPAR